ncbi:hypothetical protein M422DRAFT_774893 [Sphaerobolus stellatus SS14]|nr:hypothetical protein M422DRAFT_774893 [Sphaerobolus stellatus SS14]
MFARTLFARGLHAFRVQSTRNAPRGIRGMASGHHAPPKSDTTWIIGSAAIFVPALIWLLGPGSAKAVTGHDAHDDRHPSGHGNAPAPIMQKIPGGNTPTDAEESRKSHQEADLAKACWLHVEGQARSNVSAGEHAQGDAPRKEPANNAPAIKVDDPANHGEKPDNNKSDEEKQAKAESVENKKQGKPTGTLNKSKGNNDGGSKSDSEGDEFAASDGEQPAEAEISDSIKQEMAADAPKTAKKVEEDKAEEDKSES